MPIHILELLCPKRHCIVATAYDSEQTSDKKALGQAQTGWNKALAAGLVNPWCDLCQSRTLHWELGVSMIKTMAEIEPLLRQVEQANLASAELIKAKQVTEN